MEHRIDDLAAKGQLGVVNAELGSKRDIPLWRRYALLADAYDHQATFRGEGKRNGYGYLVPTEKLDAVGDRATASYLRGRALGRATVVEIREAGGSLLEEFEHRMRIAKTEAEDIKAEWEKQAKLGQDEVRNNEKLHGLRQPGKKARHHIHQAVGSLPKGALRELFR